MISRVLLRHLLTDTAYAGKVLPHLRGDYFSDRVDRALFEAFLSYSSKYGSFPTKEAVALAVGDKKSKLTDEEFEEAKLFLSGDDPEKGHLSWLVDETEKFCQEQSVKNAIYAAVDVLDDPSKGNVAGLPKMLQDALGVSFDAKVGHDYLADAEERLARYHEVTERLPFDIEYLNLITGGGLPKKSFSVFMAGTGVGKTIVLCHTAAAALSMGKNVLYITLELAEYGVASISERIDANLLNIPVEDLTRISKDSFKKKMQSLREKTQGRLFVKEYPPHAASAANFRHLLNELKLKKGFVPDLILVDYINLVAPQKLNIFKGNMNTYSYVKLAAEEVRGLAVEFDTRIVTATQTNRSGFSSSDPDLTDTAESFGLPQTADFFAALSIGDVLEKLGQMLFTQLKNRWRDVSKNRRFVVGLDKTRMKLYDVEKHAQSLADPGAPKPKTYTAPKSASFEGFS